MEKYRHYLYDLGLILKERALEAKDDRDAAGDGSEREYLTGRLMAFNEVLSIVQQQAKAFEIPLSELRLESLDPDRDLT
jgi:hypothetical protein